MNWSPPSPTSSRASTKKMLTLMTSWQTITVGGVEQPNDHADPDYDAAIIDKLAASMRRPPSVLARSPTTIRCPTGSWTASAPRTRAVDGRYAVRQRRPRELDATTPSGSRCTSTCCD